MNLNFYFLWILQFVLFENNCFGGKAFQFKPILDLQDKLQFLHHEQVKLTAQAKNKQKIVL